MGEDYIFRFLNHDLDLFISAPGPLINLYYEDASQLTTAQREIEMLKFMRGRLQVTDLKPVPADMSSLFGDQPDETTAFNWVYGDGELIFSRFSIPFITLHFPNVVQPGSFTEYVTLYKRMYDHFATSQILGLSYMYNIYGMKKCYEQSYYKEIGGVFIPPSQS